MVDRLSQACIGRRRLLLGALAGCIGLVPADAEAASASDGIAAVVARIRGMSSVDRAGIENALGLRLAAQADSGNRYFDIWHARGITIGSVAVSQLELREPRPGAGATGRAFLNLTIGGGCVGRREVEQRFGPLTITQVPRGRSLDEQTMLTRHERVGRLSFGFAERSPDCLRSITLAAG